MGMFEQLNRMNGKSVYCKESKGLVSFHLKTVKELDMKCWMVDWTYISTGNL